MRNIWIHTRRYKWARYLVAFAILLAFLILISIYISHEIANQKDVRKNALKEKISKTVTLCYSIEGRYPPSVEYMKDNYEFTYDENEFYIHYEMIGSNLYPSYEVFVVNQEKE